jgi:hypothetical protein
MLCGPLALPRFRAAPGGACLTLGQVEQEVHEGGDDVPRRGVAVKAQSGAHGARLARRGHGLLLGLRTGWPVEDGRARRPAKGPAAATLSPVELRV